MPTPRKPGPIPKNAKSQTDLGRYMVPPRDRKIIQLALKIPGCPNRTPDGKYPVLEWQEFVNKHFASNVAETQPDKLKLEMERLRLTNEKLTFELQVKKKDYTENAVVEQLVGQMISRAKQQFQAFRSSLPPQLVGLDEVAIEKRLSEEIARVLTHLSEKPLG